VSLLGGAAALACLGLSDAGSVQTTGAPTAAPAADISAAPPAPAAAPDKPWAPPASFADWASSIKFWGQIEAGITGNPQDPDNGVNFGQLFTDKANRPILNQLLLTVERDTDPKATDYDFGFKLQDMYGSNARITHSLGVFDHLIHDRNQIDIVEANVSVHTPWLSDGGVDLKAGIYPTPLGFEVIDPKANPFLLTFLHLQFRLAARASRRVGRLACLGPGRSVSWRRFRHERDGRRRRQ
jgi:hypothetical protein